MTSRVARRAAHSALRWNLIGRRPQIFALVQAPWLRRGACVACASVAIVGCSRDQLAPTTVAEFVPSEAPAALGAPSALQLVPLSTYDGSGQAVHPDFVSPPLDWKPGLLYLVVTPYPDGTTKYENPSLYAGNDGVTWGAAPGAPMPLAKPQQGYLSDPDILYDPYAKALVLYYRQASADDRIFRIRSEDGAQWSNPVLLLTSAFSTILSPAVVRRAHGDWFMWSVNGAPGCHGASTKVEVRHSMNGLTWSDPSPVDIPLAPGQFVWHIDTQWIPERNEFWALFPVKAPGTCATQAVYLATSPDGVTWHTIPTPVVTTGAIPEFQDVVYRSTFAYDPQSDEVTFWFSGARRAGKRITWRIAVQKRSRAELFSTSAVKAAAEIPVASRHLTASFDPP